MVNTSCPADSVASRITSGNCRSNSTAVGFPAMRSGSTLLLLSNSALGFVLVFCRPVQNSFFPDIEKPAQDQDYKQQHFKKGEQLQFPVNHRPGIQKDCFDVEKDEHHGDQVI